MITDAMLCMEQLKVKLINLQSLLGFALFFLSFLHPIKAQDSLMHYAQYLQQWGNPFEAITEYKRFVFLNPDVPDVGHAHYQMAQCYKNMQLWEEAVDAIQRSLFYAPAPVKDDRKLEIAAIQLATGNYAKAEFDLLRLHHFGKTQNMKDISAFYLGLCAVYQYQWDHAHDWFRKYYIAVQPTLVHQIDSLFIAADGLHYKSPRLALWLSTFVPGSGQVYAGDYRNGINALAINSVTVYLLVNSLAEMRLNDALTLNITLFERYYRGNRKKAESAAEAYNQNVNEAFATSVMGFLQGKGLGDK
jgi:tetratricopeptide (TPR) repeat protein